MFPQQWILGTYQDRLKFLVHKYIQTIS